MTMREAIKQADALRTKLVNSSGQLTLDKVQGFGPSITPLQPYIGKGTKFITLNEFADQLYNLTGNSGSTSSNVLQNLCNSLNQRVGASVAQVIRTSAAGYVAKVNIHELTIKCAQRLTV